MALYLETDSLSNQNIASATAIGAYTADADRSILVDVSLDQVAGNGDYVIYITRQISGAGSAYVVLPKTTATAASGETAIAMQSGAITVRSGDVLTVYVDGLAGDTTTVDTVVRWFEMDRAIAVDASGRVDVGLWLGEEPSGLISGSIATLSMVRGFASYDNQRTVLLLGGTFDKSYQGETVIAVSGLNVHYDGEYLNYQFAVLDANNSGMSFVAKVIGSDEGDGTLTLDQAIPTLGYDPEDNAIGFLLFPWSYGGASGGLTAQETRDAMMLAPTPGTPAAGSVDEHLDDILLDTGTTIPGLFAASGATVTVISAVSGGTITVYVGDTWSFTVTDSTLDLSDYEALALVVKRLDKVADDGALLRLRTDTGLERIGGAAPVDADNGTLTNTATSFTALVAMAETGGLAAGSYVWWLKGFDTTPTPDEGYTLATGEFKLERAGLAAIV